MSEDFSIVKKARGVVCILLPDSNLFISVNVFPENYLMIYMPLVFVEENFLIAM